MRRIPLRRSQLVGSNGPGSLIISPEGEMAIVGALDYWFTNEAENEANRMEFEIIEPRLRAFLGVQKLYSPPDYRKSSMDIPNKEQLIPLLRFPLWHYCPMCFTLEKFGNNNESSRKMCSGCNEKRYFKQLPFIAICKKGHITDFPWSKWIHKGQDCNGKMQLNTNSGASLDSWSVKCSCGSSRSLRGITANRGEKSTVLTEELYEGNDKYTCTGHKAWCGEVYEECHEPVMAILRNSINVYLPQKVSVISLPGERNENIDKIINIVQRNSILRNLLSGQESIENKAKLLFDSIGDKGYTIEECEKVILYLSNQINVDENQELSSPLHLRKKEFAILKENQNEPFLKVFEEWSNESEDAEQFAGKYSKYIKKVNRITKLRETTALAGFKRVTTVDDEGSYKFQPDYSLMYHKDIPDEQKWLPAYSVFGEGIFIQFNLDEIMKWEYKPIVQKYFAKYLERIKNMTHFMPEIIDHPRNLMMHTLSHLLIDEIAKTSGYSLASIRERLYVDENQAGILIYTSAGDIEGTFGGLVRMGRKQKFFKVLDNALAASHWCSSDPVCTELGHALGQGIHYSNGAACYNCTYLPETSCECGNKYLDRTLLTNEELGFFLFD